MKIELKNLNHTKQLASVFVKNLSDTGAFVCLDGDIGVGKTALVRYILQELDVKEKITSPSFTILNEYKGYKLPIYHFDLYRLEFEGVKTILEELIDYSKDGVLTFIEWSSFGKSELNFNKIDIKISYPSDDEFEINDQKRYVEFIASGDKNIELIAKIAKDMGAL